MTGTVYLLHFTAPYKHARHYLGFTSLELQERLNRHRSSDGAKLLKVVLAAGLDFEVAKTWTGNQALERRLKNLHNAPRLCPICRQEVEA